MLSRLSALRSPRVALFLLSAMLSIEVAFAEDRHEHAFVAGFERLVREAKNDSALADAGELLLGELGCVACHLPNDEVVGRVEEKRGPRLRDTAYRVREGWLRRYLSDPHAAKPGTTMPKLARSKEDVEALVHFLATKTWKDRLAEPVGESERKPDAARGRELFHRVGCVACHAPDPSYEPVADAVDVEREAIETKSAPLVALGEKYAAGSLARFLTEPLITRPHGRMADFELSSEEAADIAVFLRGIERVEESSLAKTLRVYPALAKRGAALYHELGCSACHHNEDAPPAKVLARSPKLAALGTSLESGCLSREGVANSPHYTLSTKQVDALRAAIRRIASGQVSSLSAAERADRTLARFNCYACHARGAHEGVDPGRRLYFRAVDEVDMGDEGRFPPTLTEIGRKLKPAWFEGVLDGRNELRPYLWTRMPRFDFHDTAKVVADFREADRKSSDKPYEVIGRNRYGRALVGMDGVRCIQCHDLAGRKSLGIRALDLASTAERLDPLWYREFLLDPASKRPGSRMPAMWPGGDSLFPKILGGDTSKQLDATYIYLMESEHTRLPVGMEKKDEYELRPEDRAIVLRTFMKDAGARAIAVGLPGGVNGAFDAGSGRLALLWRGRFLDAEGTWDDRFAPFEEPLSKDVLELPSGPAIRVGDGSKAASKYRGYRLDEGGAPIFHWETRGLVVEERFGVSPRGEGWIRRRLDVRDVRPPGEIDASRSISFLAARGAKVVVVSPERGEAEKTKSGDLRVPLRFEKGVARVEVDLSW